MASTSAGVTMVRYSPGLISFNSPNFIGNPSIVLRRSLLHKLISPTRQLRLSVSHGVQISCQLQTSHFLRPGETWVCNPSKIPPGRRKAPILEPYKSPIMGACSILVILGRSRPRSVRKTQAPRFHPGRQSVWPAAEGSQTLCRGQLTAPSFFVSRDIPRPFSASERSPLSPAIRRALRPGVLP